MVYGFGELFAFCFISSGITVVSLVSSILANGNNSTDVGDNLEWAYLDFEQFSFEIDSQSANGCVASNVQSHFVSGLLYWELRSFGGDLRNSWCVSVSIGCI